MFLNTIPEADKILSDKILPFYHYFGPLHQCILHTTKVRHQIERQSYYKRLTDSFLKLLYWSPKMTAKLLSDINLITHYFTFSELRICEKNRRVFVLNVMIVNWRNIKSGLYKRRVHKFERALQRYDPCSFSGFEYITFYKKWLHD